MQIGINLARETFLPSIQKLYAEKSIGFVEILIDNFLHLDPRRTREELGEVPVAFHIMSSHFLEAPEEELAQLALRVSQFARALDPIYVSDHIGQFRVNQRLLPRPAECQYREDYAHLSKRVALWQEMLDTLLYCEVFPSADAHGRDQPEFFERLLADTGARVLFDISNIVVGELNGGAPRAAWAPLAAKAERLHVAGYRLVEEVVIDSHDTNLSDDTLQYLESISPSLRAGQSIVVERDANFDLESVAADIEHVRERAGQSE
jgi:uncharacterized protein (UPF0276 family)